MSFKSYKNVWGIATEILGICKEMKAAKQIFKMEGQSLFGSSHDKQDLQRNSLECMGFQFGPFGSKLETMSGSKSLTIDGLKTKNSRIHDFDLGSSSSG